MTSLTPAISSLRRAGVSTHREQPSAIGRRAFTLLELLLVLSLMAAIAAFVWPNLQAGMASQRLRRAASILRNEWSAARVRAMSSGETVAFRHALLAERYTVVSWTRGIDDLARQAGGIVDAGAMPNVFSDAALTANNSPPADGTSGGSATTGAATGNNEPRGSALDSPLNDAFGLQGTGTYQRSGNLPGEVVFQESRLEQSGREIGLQSPSRSGGSLQENWSTPIFFFPDGTCSTATVILANPANGAGENADCIRVHLRGLTGMVDVSQIGKQEEFQQ